MDLYSLEYGNDGQVYAVMETPKATAGIARSSEIVPGRRRQS
jgi:hypothetical protein